MRVGRNPGHTAPQWSQHLRRVQACINHTEKRIINDLFKVRKLTFELGKTLYEAQKNSGNSSQGRSTLTITVPNRSRSESKNWTDKTDRPDRGRDSDKRSKNYPKVDKKTRNHSKSKKRTEPLEQSDVTPHPCPDLDHSPISSDSEYDLNDLNEIEIGTESDMAE